MKWVYASAFLLTLACADPCRAGVVLLDHWRTVMIQNNFDPDSFFFKSQTFHEQDAFQLSLIETSTGPELAGEVASRIDSDLSSSSFSAQGYAGVSYSGNRHFSPRLIDAMAANVFDVKFAVDMPTPYEFSLSGLVRDSVTFPSYTDVSATLVGPEGYVGGWKIYDGQDEFYSTGVLLPGQYHFHAGVLATLSMDADDVGTAEYSFYLTLPEPSTLLLLAMAAPFLLRKHRRSFPPIR